MHISRWLIACAVAFASVAAAQTVPFNPERWEMVGVTAFVEHDGRQIVRLGTASGTPLKTGVASLRGSNFSTGTIEFDLMVSGTREFAGIVFRGTEEGDAEYFYIRPAQNGNPDSTQYTPVVNGSPAWQIFSGEGFSSAVRFNFNQWMRLRLDVYADSALVSIDGAPALAIPHLKSDSRSGLVELTAVAGAHFANLTITPIENYRNPNPAPPEAALPAGTVATWQVSPAMGQEEAMRRAAQRDWAGVDWRRVPAESNGIGNLSRAGPEGEGRHSYIARFTLRSQAARTAAMQFGFSDSVHVFLNGRPLYAGADVQASRDYRFLGIVGLWDSLFLPLEAGANEVVFVVADGTNGGVAAAARLEPDPGVSIE